MKKYIPSGYQIINLDVSDKTSGTAFEPETEDEKLLYEILSSGEIKKPILLCIETPNVKLMGFPVINGDTEACLTFGAVGYTITEDIQLDGTKLIWTETEE